MPEFIIMGEADMPENAEWPAIFYSPHQDDEAFAEVLSSVILGLMDKGYEMVQSPS
jgi:hypothetical protein